MPFINKRIFISKEDKETNDRLVALNYKLKLSQTYIKKQDSKKEIFYIKNNPEIMLKRLFYKFMIDVVYRKYKTYSNLLESKKR
jgi:hypothetical protein